MRGLARWAQPLRPALFEGLEHQVAALLGHSELRTTTRYAHLQPQVLAEAAGRFSLPAPPTAK